MEFYPQKCLVLQISNKRQLIRHPYTIHGHIFEIVESARYLGVNIHNKFNWNHHINQVTKEANNTRAFL